MAKLVNAVLASSHGHSKITANYRTINLENHLKTR